MKKILAVALSFLSACGDGLGEKPTGPSSACTVTVDGTGNIVGCGDVRVVITPAASPSPTPGSGSPKCDKSNPVYIGNVLEAWRTIVPAEPSMRAHIAALVSALKKAGFQATSGGTLSDDEIAVKIDAFSETYDVWLGAYTTEYSAQVLYVTTCTPARF